jgi:fibrillarin-like rRNA methylase
MHTLTIRTKFTFGDRVRWKPMSEHRPATGTVVGILIDARRPIKYRYCVEVDDDPCVQDVRRESDLDYLEAN